MQVCDICKMNKPDHGATPGLLQPLSILDQAWSHISMDFVEGLPNSRGKNAILVTIDRFTKYGHFIALSHPFTTHSVAKLFLENIYKLHGLPVRIVTDRDKVFMSSFWKEVFKVLGVTLNFFTSYYPQTDGQTERLNQCMENYLRCMTSNSPMQWYKWLSLAKHWYNTNFHTAIKVIPFKALYGYEPPYLSMGPNIDSNQTEVRDLV